MLLNTLPLSSLHIHLLAGHAAQPRQKLFPECGVRGNKEATKLCCSWDETPGRAVLRTGILHNALLFLAFNIKSRNPAPNVLTWKSQNTCILLQIAHHVCCTTFFFWFSKLLWTTSEIVQKSSVLKRSSALPPICSKRIKNPITTEQQLYLSG